MRPTTTLPLTWTLLRLLILLNWASGAAILALLGASVFASSWMHRALGIPPSPDIFSIMNGMRLIAALGLLAIPINHAILSRLLPIIETVRRRDPFIAANAYRINMIAWALLALQLIGLAIGMTAQAIETPTLQLHIDAGFSLAGWLAVLLTFILARVFAEGTLMREDLEGMI